MFIPSLKFHKVVRNFSDKFIDPKIRKMLKAVILVGGDRKGMESALNSTHFL